MANVVLKPGAIDELLHSKELEADLLSRAERIAAAAGPGHRTDSFQGATRARAYVWTATPEAMGRESTEMNLTRALDAGR